LICINAAGENFPFHAWRNYASEALAVSANVAKNKRYNRFERYAETRRLLISLVDWDHLVC
jgi:hypothetical protein